MIYKIAKKEFTEMRRDGRFRAAGLIICALLLASLAIGFKQYSETRADRTAAQEATYEQWLSQGERNPHGAAHFGMYTFKPFSVLAFIDKGTENYTGTAIFLEAHKQNEFLFRPAKDTASVSRFGELTAAAVLQMLVPLLIILLSFAAFSGEREAGTLRQTLSLGISRRTLGFGKALGISAALGILFIPAIVPALIVLVVFGEGGGNITDELLRGTFLLIAYLFYFALILLISLAVSAIAPSSRTALIFLLGFWIIAGLIVPRASADLAKRVYPTPSGIEFSDEMYREILHGEQGRNEKLKAETLARYNVEKIEDLPFNFEGLDLQNSEDKGNEIIDKFYDRLEEIFSRQNRLQEIAAVLSPTQAARLASMGFAGTDTAHQRDFMRTTENYRRDFVKELNLAVMRNDGEIDPDYRGTSGFQRKTGREMWEKIPQFSYQKPNVLWVLQNQIVSLAILLIWLAAAFALAWFSIVLMKVD